MHRFGQAPSDKSAIELLLAIARSPSSDHPGLTQAIARRLELNFDPWCDEEGELLSNHDSKVLISFCLDKARRKGDAVAWIEEQALMFLNVLLGKKQIEKRKGNDENLLVKF